MCNACGFLCCAYDGFEGCGCDHCPEPSCHACFNCGEPNCDGECRPDEDDYEHFSDPCEPDQVPTP